MRLENEVWRSLNTPFQRAIRLFTPNKIAAELSINANGTISKKLISKLKSYCTFNYSPKNPRLN